MGASPMILTYIQEQQMNKLFSDLNWTFPLAIRQRMAEDITNFGHITLATRRIQNDFLFSMNDQALKDYQAGY
jgi:hypothetical protein